MIHLLTMCQHWRLSMLMWFRACLLVCLPSEGLVIPSQLLFLFLVLCIGCPPSKSLKLRSRWRHCCAKVWLNLVNLPGEPLSTLSGRQLVAYVYVLTTGFWIRWWLNTFPLPRIYDLFEWYQCVHFPWSAVWISTNRFKDKDVPKTAFKTHQGLFEFKVLSFGLTNAPACLGCLKAFPMSLHMLMTFWSSARMRKNTCSMWSTFLASWGKPSYMLSWLIVLSSNLMLKFLAMSFLEKASM